RSSPSRFSAERSGVVIGTLSGCSRWVLASVGALAIGLWTAAAAAQPRTFAPAPPAAAPELPVDEVPNGEPEPALPVDAARSRDPAPAPAPPTPPAAPAVQGAEGTEEIEGVDIASPAGETRDLRDRMDQLEHQLATTQETVVRQRPFVTVGGYVDAGFFAPQ